MSTESPSSPLPSSGSILRRTVALTASLVAFLRNHDPAAWLQLVAEQAGPWAAKYPGAVLDLSFSLGPTVIGASKDLAKLWEVSATRDHIIHSFERWMTRHPAAASGLLDILERTVSQAQKA